MKILVYGAGVLGSYLAYELKKTNKDITILARGERYKELKENGLIIRHYIQRKTTKTEVQVVDSFKKEDYYDIVFIVMQNWQIKDILPGILENEICKTYVFIGNNFQANNINEVIINNSAIKPKILFGFLGAAGKGENNKIISVHKSKTTLALGSIKDEHSIDKINRIFKESDLKLEYYNDIDSYLKYHVALILPIVYLCHYVKGNLKIASKDKKLIQDLIEAIIESYAILKSLNINSEEMDYLEYMQTAKKKYYWLFKIALRTPIGKLAFGEHAMSGIKEMNVLDEEFYKLKVKSQIATPHLDKLRKYLIKSTEN